VTAPGEREVAVIRVLLDEQADRRLTDMAIYNAAAMMLDLEHAEARELVEQVRAL
jgi:hypothetical protein